MQILELLETDCKLNKFSLFKEMKEGVGRMIKEQDTYHQVDKAVDHIELLI